VNDEVVLQGVNPTLVAQEAAGSARQPSTRARRERSA
jgi:hypothetical protein